MRLPETSRTRTRSRLRAGRAAAVLACAAALVLGTLSATSARAATPTAQATCATFAAASAITASDPAAASFYADCVPQYGVGALNFALKSPHNLNRFSPTDPDDVAGVYSTLAPNGANAYFQSTTAQRQFFSWSLVSGTMSSFAILRITKVEKLTKTALSSTCQPSTKHYDGVYRFSFAPIETTIQTTTDAEQSFSGSPGAFPVEASVPTMTLGLNFSEGVASTADHFNSRAPQCAMFAGKAVYASSALSNWLAYSAVTAAARYQAPSSLRWLDAGTSTLSAALVQPGVYTSVSGHAGAATLTTTIKGATGYQHGVVTISVDGKRLRTEGALVSGKLTVALPKALTAGSHSATIVFPGGPGALPITVDKPITVAR